MPGEPEAGPLPLSVGRKININKPFQIARKLEDEWDRLFSDMNAVRVAPDLATRKKRLTLHYLITEARSVLAARVNAVLVLCSVDTPNTARGIDESGFHLANLKVCYLLQLIKGRRELDEFEEKLN